MVRATAVQSLGRIVEDRTTAVIAAHLTDASRVVRVRAAAALLDRGIARLDGSVGAALARAQDEWADSLRTFNEPHGSVDARLARAVARTHRSGDRGARHRGARRPRRPQPHVYLGVAAARAGRYEEAVKQFTAARALKRDYPNIDKLIDEAQKRR